MRACMYVVRLRDGFAHSALTRIRVVPQEALYPAKNVVVRAEQEYGRDASAPRFPGKRLLHRTLKDVLWHELGLRLLDAIHLRAPCGHCADEPFAEHVYFLSRV